MLIGYSLLIVSSKLFLLKPMWSALVSLCLLLVTSLLIQRVFPVLLKVLLLVGLWTWPLLYSQCAGRSPDVTCRFDREEGSGSRRDFFVGCPSVLAASRAFYVTD